MTHDPIPKIGVLTARNLYRLWTRPSSIPHHWTMEGVGHLDDIESLHAHLFVHEPDRERLILPAAETPCGLPAPCSLCDRPAEYHGRAQDGSLILLCPRCLQRSMK